MPITGKIPKFMPICIKIWENSMIAMPEAKRRGKFVRAEIAIFIIRHIKIINRKRRRNTPIKPNSSAITAKIKSVCGSDKKPY